MRDRMKHFKGFTICLLVMGTLILGVSFHTEVQAFTLKGVDQDGKPVK